MTADVRIVEVSRLSGFDDVVDSIAWEAGEAPADLCAITTEQGLGCLALSERPNMVTTSPTEIRAVLSFVDLRPAVADLTVPRNLQQVADISGNVPTVQNPNVAKGVGILGGNTAGAVASHYVRGNEAAVRVIRVNGMGDVWVDPESTVLGGILKHAGKMMREWASSGDAKN